MNFPSRTDEPFEAGYNQNPPHLSADLTTTADLNGIVNSRVLRRMPDESHPEEISYEASIQEPPGEKDSKVSRALRADLIKVETYRHDTDGHVIKDSDDHEPTTSTEAVSWRSPAARWKVVNLIKRIKRGGRSEDHVRSSQTNETTASGFDPKFGQKVQYAVIKYAKFIGPGFVISVSYVDPGNYSTDVAAGASNKFKLLFVVLMSNIFAVFLQSLCIKLGTVTGLNLAENCRAHCPKWLNISLYILAEVAIIATDIAEVIGTAIALNLLCSKIPLVAGCILSILDVFLILAFYRPNGTIKGLQTFEFFVAALVLGVVVSFCIELSLIKEVSAGEVFRGYLPSSALVKPEGLFQACGILGATVMPHSLYLGSGIVQPRLIAFDIKNGYTHPPAHKSTRTSISVSPHSSDDAEENATNEIPYRPSLAAIKFCLKYSIIELSISLFTFALFVNSAILIVAGASLSSDPSASNADLFSIHSLLSTSLAPAAGVVFALALLLSGISAGVVCTIAGQMVSEGALNWSLAPWLRRLVTRSISITPSIIIAGAVGREGLSAALNGTQVVLSVVLPFVSAPLIWFTCRGRYMTVQRSSVALMSGVVSTGPSAHHSHDSEMAGAQQSRESPTGGENSNAADTTTPESKTSNNNTSARPPVPSNFSSSELEAGTTQNHRNGHGNGIREDMHMSGTGNGRISMGNHWVTTVFAVLIWLVIAIMNVANLVLLKNQ